MPLKDPEKTVEALEIAQKIAASGKHYFKAPELPILAKALINRDRQYKAAMDLLRELYMDTSTSMPAAWNDEVSWYKSQLHDCIGRAARGYKAIQKLDDDKEPKSE